MPFRDRDWEDFQRDCNFFPAYTDYIFGIDTRPEVDEEPGLHPQIFDPQPMPQLAPQRLYGLPQPVQYPVAYDPVRDATQPHLQTMPTLQRASMLRQEPSMESLQPTPCPAPRVLPGAGPQEKLLRPNELATDPAYSFIPQQERMMANKNIIQAWSILHSDAIPPQKAKAMGYIKNMSRSVAAKRQEWEALQAARLQAETMAEEEAEALDKADQAEAQAEREAEDWYQKHGNPGFYAGDRMSDPRGAEAEAEIEAEKARERIPTRNGYAIRDLLQVPAYVQSHLSQLWTCAEIIALKGPPTNPAHIVTYQQAQQFYTDFVHSIPPGSRKWLNLVVDGMIKLRKQGDDPMTVLQTMPSVESTL